MRPDRFRSQSRGQSTDERARRQIALEAARRLFDRVGPETPEGPLREVSVADYYNAKRQAAAVLGRRVRPGDLPSDSEVREEVLTLARSLADAPGREDGIEPEPEPEALPRLGDHLDRFAIYKMRLEPLHDVKQNPKYHPEGDTLYHSLQVFALAREVRPYDEEFLLAALLHDVGKAIEPDHHVAAGLEALAGTITERTAWLIEHHMDLLNRPGRTLSARQRRVLEESEFFEDLRLLRDLDEAGRAVGVDVPSVDDALAYLRDLEREAYLEDDEA